MSCASAIAKSGPLTYSALSPFHSDTGSTLFSSNGVRKLSQFGYTYPEISDWNTTAHDLKLNVQTQINQLYNYALSTRSISPGPRRSWSHGDIARCFSHITLGQVRKLGVNNSPLQWSIQVQGPRNAFHKSIVIDFFMGNGPIDPLKRATASNLIGSFVSLVAHESGSVVSAKGPPGIIHGAVSLTHIAVMAVQRGVLNSHDATNMVPLLSRHLTWYARTPMGEDIRLGEVTGLEMSVASRTLAPIKRLSDAPVYGPLVTHLDITAQRGSPR